MFGHLLNHFTGSLAKQERKYTVDKRYKEEQQESGAISQRRKHMLEIALVHLTWMSCKGVVHFKIKSHYPKAVALNRFP
tara:strand:+ start:464 stop:700 length:237 start_codon:yes stop_codon:yes gene_type:complete